MIATEVVVKKGDPAYAGQAAYTRRALRVYDLIAYRLDSPLFWRCSLSRLLAIYDEHVSARHLDVGVGSGYLLHHCDFPVAAPQITLMDLNPDPLAFAARRLRRYGPRTHRANVLTPWGLSAESFDSVAMCNVLNCAPGSMPEKAVAFDHARAVLAPGGCLFGTTVLNGGVEQTRRSRMALKRLNQRGVFDNLADHRDDLEAALAQRFSSFEVSAEGSMAFFVARADV
jgi:SAM-dependent methyltransferase